MNEQKIIKKTMAKNILLNFIIFLIMFLIFDVIIYKQISNSLYLTIDEEIGGLKQQYEDIEESDTIDENNIENGMKELPKGINEEGRLNRVISPRVINIIEDANKNLAIILFWGTIILLVIALIASYALAKRVVKPIMKNYKKQTEFVQNASHELRTPLAIIQAQQELLLKEPNSKIIDQSENINQTLKETKRMTKLIKELMDLARSDNCEEKLNKTKFDINELIKEISAPYKEYAKLQQKEIILDLKETKPIKADKDRISELLIIILDNSIKYTNSQDTITIKTERKEGKLNIEIADTGIGIDDKAMPHIFERFYRGDESHSKKIEGSGLGLSIAQSIVNMHKGSIKAFHNTPKGTKIIIKI